MQENKKIFLVSRVLSYSNMTGNLGEREKL